MKRQIQKAGVRKWYGEAFIMLQDQLYEAIEAIGVGLNTNFVIKGCNVTGSGPYDISEGIVFIDGNICFFSGLSGVSLPVYLNKQVTETDDQPYVDGISRPTEKWYQAISGTDSSPYIEIGSASTFKSAVAPLTDSLSLGGSDIGASAQAAKLLQEAIASINSKYPYGSVVHGNTSLADYAYRKIAADTVQLQLVFPTSAPGILDTIMELPEAYRPANSIMKNVSDGVIRIASTGVVQLFSGSIQEGAAYHYFIDFPIWPDPS